MIQYGVFLLIVTALVYPFGGYLTRVFAGESTWLDAGLLVIPSVARNRDRPERGPVGFEILKWTC